MSDTQLTERLRAGIKAAKDGEREKAHQLFLDILEADEENELAWLWMSGVVHSADEKRICLENVLTLNPENQVAKRGLEILGPVGPGTIVEESIPPSSPDMEEKVLQREYKPVSTAAAILYPDSHVPELRWQEPVVEQKASQAEFKAASSYNDIWSKNIDICAFCAHEVADEDTQCPKCRRNLISKRYTYPQPSSNMHVYWVLLVGLGQLFLIEAIVHIVVGKNHLTATSYAALLLVFWFLAAGVYFRLSWAHVSSIVMLVLVLLGFLINFLVDIDFSTLGLEALDSSIRDFVSPLIAGTLDFLKVFEVLTAVLGLFYGIFKAGPDFEQVTSRLIANITKGRLTAADYHNIARTLSGKGMWAAAILHWQRASAQEPGQVAYQKQLGLAYGRLGFHKRGLDVLQSAHDISTYPPTKAELAEQIQLVKKKIANQPAETAVTR